MCPGSKKAKAKLIADVIGGAFSAYHLKGKVKEYAAFPYWEEIVGPDLAKVAIPERIIRRKVLVVRVLDAVWAQDLTLRKDELLSKLTEFGEGALLQDIKFVTGNPRTVKGK